MLGNRFACRGSGRLSEKQEFDQRCRAQDQYDNDEEQNDGDFPIPDDIGFVECHLSDRAFPSFGTAC
jgi:hypothetical protein